MLLTGVGLFGAFYIGIRFFEKKHKKKEQKNKSVIVSGKNREIENIQEDEDTAIGRITPLHIKAGVAALALSVIRPFFPFIFPLQIAIIFFMSFPIFRRAEEALIKEKKLRAAVLTSVFILSCIATGQYIGLIIGTLFFLCGSRIVSKARSNFKKKLIGTLDNLPDNIWLIKDNIEIEIPLSEVCNDDIIVVNTGSIVPVDGVIIEGAAMVDMHTLTGEFQPAEKIAGDRVFASTIVMNGRILIKAEETGEYTAAAKIDIILRDTANFKSDLQLKGEKWADQVVAPVLGISILSLPLIHFWGVAALLNCAFEARIMMLAPLGTLNHLNIALRKKIFIKDGRALERMSQIDTVIFDKTGTLTSELPEVKQIVPCDGYDEDTILSYAATAECKMTHPIAVSIIEKAKESGIFFTKPDTSDYRLGYGVTVKTDNHVIRLGSIRFMKTKGILIPEKIEKVIGAFHERGNSTVMISIDNDLGGVIELCPLLRPEVEDVIKGLRSRGVKHLSIVSGDHEKPVRQLAESLCCDSYFSEILPENKATIVEKLQNEGKTVCFIGDGVNDTIAMKKADVSISLSGATSIAMDTAQVVMMNGNLSMLCDLFDISRRLKINAKKDTWHFTCRNGNEYCRHIFFKFRSAIYDFFKRSLAISSREQYYAPSNFRTE